MKFSQVALLSTVAGSSLAVYTNGTVTDIQTTVVTITSCEENKCHETAVTTGLTTVTELETTYTTYCPISEESQASSAPAPSAPAPAPSSEAEESKPAASSTPQTVEAQSSSAPATSAPSVTAAEGSGAKVVAPVAAGLLALGALL
ncbi:unnamed protein product [Candida verbasci]|uniref:Uncharacterized protein n=1 Tax=Candida verbasci TaxID=1227364 RepID=A0A9W4TXN7_9ASCO|nr:unnamed protein product [Candida verbasci]